MLGMRVLGVKGNGRRRGLHKVSCRQVLVRLIGLATIVFRCGDRGFVTSQQPIFRGRRGIRLDGIFQLLPHL